MVFSDISLMAIFAEVTEKECIMYRHLRKYTFRDSVVISVFFTALHVMQTRYCEENSVCPSVRLSVCLSHACIVTKRKKNLSRFLYRTKDNLA